MNPDQEPSRQDLLKAITRLENTCHKYAAVLDTICVLIVATGAAVAITAWLAITH